MRSEHVLYIGVIIIENSFLTYIRKRTTKINGIAVNKYLTTSNSVFLPYSITKPSAIIKATTITKVNINS